MTVKIYYTHYYNRETHFSKISKIITCLNNREKVLFINLKFALTLLF